MHAWVNKLHAPIHTQKIAAQFLHAQFLCTRHTTLCLHALKIWTPQSMITICMPVKPQMNTPYHQLGFIVYRFIS